MERDEPMMNYSRFLAARLAALALIATTTACGAFERKDESGGKASKTEPAPVKPADPTKPSDPNGTTPGGKQPSPLALTGALVTFPDCSAVEAYIENDEIASMRRQIEDQIKWLESPQSIGGDAKSSVAMPGAAPESAVEASGASDGGGDAASGPKEHTGTNNQVEGVEEGDFVKNDGTHVFHASRGKLRILKSWPANEMGLVSTLDLEGRAFELLLDEAKHRLVVLSHPRMTAEDLAAEAAKYSGSNGGMAEPAIDIAPFPSNMPRFDRERVEVSTIDVTNPAAPALTGKFMLRGNHLASRRIGGAVRLVLQTYRPYLDGLKMWIDYPESQTLKKDEKIARLKAFVLENEALIKAKDLKYWLNFDADFKLGTAGVKEPLVDLGTCSGIHAPTVASQSGLTRVASLDLDQGTISETLLLSHVDEVYASLDNLYLASRYWWWSSDSRDTDATFVHKFNLKDPATAPYLASGRIEGMPLNQFSFDEFDGRLRVASTHTKYSPQPQGEGVATSGASVGSAGTAVSAEAPVAEDAPAPDAPKAGLALQEWVPPVTVNRIVVLEQVGAELKQVGISEDLAPGERIMSARFRGPRGFIVTFRQVDPLFTLDLADPAAPKVMGALKIPGYSSYMHFTDDTHLLAVGRSGDESGLNGGMKISLFDVSDLANPLEVQKLELGGDGNSQFWSDAEWDHKAFTYFASKKLLALPITGYTYVDSPKYWYSRYESSLFVFSVDAGAGIAQVGKVGMDGLYDGLKRDEGFWFGGARVNRSFFADDIVYAISDFGVRAANVNDLSAAAPVGSVAYQCDQTCFDQWYWWY